MSRVRLTGSTSGYVEITAPAIAGNNTVTLPSSNGSANQLLKNGATPGVLEYSAVSIGSTGELDNIASINGGPLAGFRNRIINGNFAISQRGAGPFTNPGYGADRWLTTWAGGGSIQFGSTASGPSGFSTSGFINYASGTITDAIFQQRIESANCKDLVSGGQITISFWAFTNKTGGWTPACDLKFPTAADDYTATTAIINGVSLSAIAASTWTKLTVTVTLSGTPSNGLELTIHSGVMASGENRLITGVQLEPGPVATQFEQRPIGTELALCQRYFYAPNEVPSWKADAVYNGASLFAHFYYPTTMRTAPTLNGGWIAGTNAAAGTIVATRNLIQAQLFATTFASYSAGLSVVSLSAEL